MEELIINGQQRLQGTIVVQGSKNAATKLLAASVLSSTPCHFRNVPRVEDVHRIIELLEGVGANITWATEHQVIVDTRRVDPGQIAQDIVRKLRSSAVLMGAMIGRAEAVSIAGPGGDQIGARPLDTHVMALQDVGISVHEQDGQYVLRRGPRGDVDLTMSEFSVTATENVLMASVTATGKRTVIRCAAADPSVQDLCWFLVSMGARIDGIGTSTLTINGVDELSAREPYTVMPDPVEAGTLICLAAAARAEITVEGIAPSFLVSELQKFKEANVQLTLENRRPSENPKYELVDVVIRHSAGLRALRKVHNMPFPGFSADLLPPFAVMMTQADGTTLIHDWMYESRLKYVEELNKMGAEVFVADPHRILVSGPRALFGTAITNYDIRTGAALIIAGLIASGTTIIRPAYQLDRGYERLDLRLNALGAAIQRSSAT